MMFSLILREKENFEFYFYLYIEYVFVSYSIHGSQGSNGPVAGCNGQSAHSYSDPWYGASHCIGSTISSASCESLVSILDATSGYVLDKSDVSPGSLVRLNKAYAPEKGHFVESAFSGRKGPVEFALSIPLTWKQ